MSHRNSPKATTFVEPAAHLFQPVSHTLFSPPAGPIRILRLPDIKARTGYCRTSIYNKVKQGLWPRQVYLPGGNRAVGWPEHEVASVLAAAVAGKSTEEIRSLVAALEASRQALA